MTSTPIPTHTPLTEQALEAGKLAVAEKTAALQRALEEAGLLARQGAAKARQAGDATVGYIQQEPLKAVLIAAAVGAAGAALVGWLSRPR